MLFFRNFLSGSLDNLFKRIKSVCKFKIMKQSSMLADIKSGAPKQNFSERINCMKRKGTFPYSWAQTVECYDYPQLVEKKHFFNTLTQSHITDREYDFAKMVWKTFDMKTMNDYCRMYCLAGRLIVFLFIYHF